MENQKGKISYLIVIFALLVIIAGIFIFNYNRTGNNSNLKLENIENKELLGENSNYSVYLVNPKENKETGAKTGEIIVNDKKSNTVTKITGTFSIFGATIVIDDGKGGYILLSTGTYISRTVIPISLAKKARVTKEFCALSDFLFYKDYAIYGNCDRFDNRPWGSGEAPSIVALNLQTGQEKTIAKSDLTHQYGLRNQNEPTQITGDTLNYVETSVVKSEDWSNPDNQKTALKTYNLLSL